MRSFFYFKILHSYLCDFLSIFEPFLCDCFSSDSCKSYDKSDQKVEYINTESCAIYENSRDNDKQYSKNDLQDASSSSRKQMKVKSTHYERKYSKTYQYITHNNFCILSERDTKNTIFYFKFLYSKSYNPDDNKECSEKYFSISYLDICRTFHQQL